MNLIIEVLAALLAIFSIIVIHELGHFTLAKLLGVKVLRFSIGFGKSLWSFHSKSGTEYRLSALPLGGYVKLLNEAELAQYPQFKSNCYEVQPLWKRVLILLAGPFSNFLLAVVLFWFIFMFGFHYLQPVVGEVIPNSPAALAGLQPGDEILRIKQKPVYDWGDMVLELSTSVGDTDLVPVEVNKKGVQTKRFISLNHLDIKNRQFNVLKAVGIQPYMPLGKPVIAKVASNSPAERALLQPGDIIESIADHPVKNWNQAQKLLRDYPSKTINIGILRGDKKIVLPANLEKHIYQNQAIGYLGVSFKIPPFPKGMIKHRKYNVITAWIPAVNEIYNLIILNIKILIKMFQGQISLSGLSGPVGIVQTAGVASQAGIQIYLRFVALISVALGFVNLLPIPLLDGGHLTIEVIESVFRRKIPVPVKKVMWSIGIAFLLLIMIYATYNDILQLIIPFLS